MRNSIIGKKLLDIFDLDLRSLAILRIGLALSMIISLFGRFKAIAENYSDLGTLPRRELIDIIPSEYWSLNLITGSILGQQILFIISLLAAILLLIGYRTKPITFICWVMLVSLHNRNPELVSNGEDIIRIMIFWGIFLPLGAYYSGDRALDTSSKLLPQKVISVGTIAFIFQIFAVFVFCAKNLDFSPILFVTLLAFIPSNVWNFLFKKNYTKEIAGLIINYDRDCGFCKKVVYSLCTFLILPGVTIREAQVNPSICADMKKYNSWVIEDYRGKKYFKWYGIACVVSISPVLFWLAPILHLKPLMKLGNKIYEFIANNRRLMGNFTKPFVFRQQSIKQPLFLNILSILILLLAIWGNFNLYKSLDAQNNLTIKTAQITKILRLDLPNK